MKKINDFLTICSGVGVQKLSILSVLCMVFGLTACTDEVKYEAAEVPTNAQVYFLNDLPLRLDLNQDLSVTSFDVEVRRVDKSNALTVNITTVNENPDIFTVPSSVSFTAGSDAANFTVSYNPEELGFNNYLPLIISLQESLTSPYGKSVWDFKAGIPEPWESLGIGKYNDYWIMEERTLFDVEIQQNMIDRTRYRLVDPYTEWLEESGEDTQGNQSPYVEFRILPVGSVFKDVTITMEGLVVYDDFNTGVYHTGYEEDILCMHPARFVANTTESSWSHNIVLQFSGDGKPEVVQIAPYYYMMGVGGWNQSANDGMITIIFPGVEFVNYDFSAEITYIGRLTDKNGDDFAVAEVSLGEDVAYAKVALVSGGMSQAVLTGTLDGSIESDTIKTDGRVQIPCSETGTYTFIVITYDANDEPQEYEYDTFDFFSSAGGGGSETTIDDFYGDYTLTGTGLWADQGQPDANMQVNIAAGNEPNTLIITGIDLAESLTAIFNPKDATMTIAPQDLADFWDDDYEETVTNVFFATLTPDADASETDELSFYRMLNGSLTLTSVSDAIGYVIFGDDEDGDNWAYDGYYNLLFTPSTSRSAVLAKPFNHFKANEAKVAKISKKENNNKHEFSMHPFSKQSPINKTEIIQPF